MRKCSKTAATGLQLSRVIQALRAGLLPCDRCLRFAFALDSHSAHSYILKLHGGKIIEEIGLDDGVTALTQLGLIKKA